MPKTEGAKKLTVGLFCEIQKFAEKVPNVKHTKCFLIQMDVVIFVPKVDLHLEVFCCQHLSIELQNKNVKYGVNIEDCRCLFSHLPSFLLEFPVQLVSNLNNFNEK